MKSHACHAAILLTSLLCFTGCQANSASLVDDDPYREQIDALADPYFQGEYFVGLSVGVLTSEGRYTYHYGVTLADGPVPDDDTLYEIGSITKTMTGLLLADGVTRGLYTLDTPVQDLLGGKTQVDPRITLGRLSTHNSGLPRIPLNMWPMDLDDPYAAYDAARLLAYLEKPFMESEPGTKASYSNLGVGLLGYALAEQAGMGYESLLRLRVLTPLGMDQTTVTLNDVQLERTASPHRADGEPSHLWGFMALAGAGGVRSNVQDMLTYAQAQLHPDATPLAEAIRLSQQPQNRAGEASFDNPMGLGWFIVANGTTLTHGGKSGGFKSIIAINLEQGTALVVLTNSANSYAESIAAQIGDLLAGLEVRDVDLPIPAEVPEHTLDEYTGQYVLVGAGVVEITREGGRLYAQITGQPRLRLFAKNQDTFRYRAVEATIDFERDEQGRVYRLVLRQNGKEHLCPRVPAESTTPPQE